MVNIDLIKKHLNIDTEFDDDNEYLLFLDSVAVATIERHIDKSYNQLAAENGGAIPFPILQAELLYIGNLYNSRESITFGSADEIPFTYDYLLALYKDYSKKENDGGVFA